MMNRWIACLTFFVFLSLASYAHSSIEYRVKKGDNPSRIAKKYKVSVNDILSVNSIDPKGLKPGRKIIIPVEKSSQSKRKIRSAQTSSDSRQAGEKTGHAVGQSPDGHDSQAAETVLPADQYYTVKKGDTLSSISRTYSVSSRELRELNGLKKTSRLRQGQKLLLRQDGPKTYIVKKGDTVQKVARKFDMAAADLIELNELESDSLKVGRKLYLEERADPDSAGMFRELIARNNEEEIRKILESEEFIEKDQPDKLITFAKKMLNIPYKFGGNSILGIDCSAYVKKVYGFFGVNLPRTAREQFQNGEAIDKEELSIGDLVFFRTYASFPSHVGIYLGNNLFIHASSKGKKVTINSLDTPYYLKRFIGGKRFLTEGEQEKDSNS